MTMKLKFDGWMQPYECRALGDMFHALAVGLEAQRSDARARSLAPPEGGQNIADYADVAEAATGTDVAEAFAALRAGDFLPSALGAANAATKRERGKPSPGRARRTGEEVAQDKAAEARDAQIAERMADDENHSRVMAVGSAAVVAEDTKANISTGEERIDPTAPKDAAQDAADEAVEAEAAKTPKLTHEDVRDALQKYVKTYGFAVALEDGPKVLKMLFGDKTAMVSDMPGDQESLANAIAGIEEMLTKNPFKRGRVVDDEIPF